MENWKQVRSHFGVAVGSILIKLLRDQKAEGALSKKLELDEGV